MKLRTKRKLVKSYSSETSTNQCRPWEYKNIKRLWLAHVRVESTSGWVDDYEIEPDKKLYWKTFLALITEEIEKLDDSDDTDWRVDIYKLSSSIQRRKL
jgi:hypothetical protein